MSVAAMGWRNLRRNPRRTWITVAALAGGLALSTWAWAIVQGMLGDMMGAMVRGRSGHVELLPPGQLAEPSIYDAIPGSTALLRELRSDPRVAVAAPRVSFSGLLASDDQAFPAMIRGVDAPSETALNGLGRKTEAGRLARSPGEVALGADLADRLGAGLGSDLTLVGQAADGSLATAAWRVVGLVRSGDDMADRGTAWMDEAAAEGLLLLDGAHEIALYLRDDGQVPAMVSELAARDGWTGVRSDAGLAPEPGQDPARTPVDPEATVVARSWRSANPAVARYHDLARVWSFFTVGLVLLTAGMGAMNTLLMSVLERTREIGVLLAVGLEPRQVVGMVVLESLSLSLLASGMGLVAGAAGMWWLCAHGIDLSAGHGDLVFAGVSMEPIYRARWSVEAFAWPMAILLLISLAASTWPAWRAARLDPVEAMGRT